MTTPVRRRAYAALFSFALAIGLATAPAPAAEAAPALPPGFVLRDQPSGQEAFDLTDFTYLPDNSVLSTGKQGNVAWVSPDGESRSLAQLPVEPVQDLGLVGIAVAPDFETSRHIYLARSVPDGAPGYRLRLARWTVTGSPEPTGITGERVLFDVISPSIVHGITGIVPDRNGSLWVSIGDLADYTRTDRTALNAYDLDSPAGKIVHITPDGRGVASNPYFEPSDPSSWRSRVYASGFRSPFRLSLDPATGTPIVGDVGYFTWEEVDVVRPGQNYQWPCWEGNHPSPGYADLPECAGVTNTPPVWEYRHGSGIDQGNSVTGGIVYQGTSYPEQYRGTYFFGDYSTKKLWSMRFGGQGRLVSPPQSPPLGTDIGGPVKFEAAPNGDIVYADIYSGMLRRLSYVEGNSPPIAKAATTTDPATRTVTFDGSGSTDFDGDTLRYEWDFGDGSTGAGVVATHTYAPGADEFTATLTVRDPLDATGTVEVIVAPSNYTPELMLTPPAGPDFAVGGPISLSATATDTEDGPLPVTWTSSVVHCPEEATCHNHPGPGGEGSTLETTFTDHPDSRMEFTATATDSRGVRTTETYVAPPREHLLTLESNLPAVLQIPVEGGKSSTYVTENATTDVLAAATAADGSSEFLRWEDGTTSRSRLITMPAGDLTLRAEYASAIEARYAAEPELRTLLGPPTGPEVVDGPVHHRSYSNGRLYWSAATGVHEIHGANLAKYLELGGHGRFGPPTTDETRTPDGAGRYNHFELGASVYWTPGTGAHGIWGGIRATWSRLGWETGPMGYPTTDETITPDRIGRYNHFTKAASIYWSPRTGAHEIYGRIRERWSALGWENSYLGYPTTGEFGVSGGRQNNFQFGYTRWNAWNNSVIDRRY